jgi:hypothetical protein
VITGICNQFCREVVWQSFAHLSQRLALSMGMMARIWSNLAPATSVVIEHERPAAP